MKTCTIRLEKKGCFLDKGGISIDERVSIKDNSGNPCQDDHQDRIDLELPGEDECTSEDQEAFIVDEVLAVHQQQGGGCNQSDHYRT